MAKRDVGLKSTALLFLLGFFLYPPSYRALERYDMVYPVPVVNEGLEAPWEILDEATERILRSNDLSAPADPFGPYTSYFVEVRRYWDRLPRTTQEQLRPFFLRPDDPGSPYYREGGLPLIYDTKHFRYHYTTVGPYAPPLEDLSPADGVPDYIQVVAEAYEKAYRVLINKMGYIAPFDDRWLEDNGGDEKWDVYLFTGPWGAFTAPEYMVNIRSSTSATFSVYFAVNIRYHSWFGKFEGTQALETAAAHEFFHAIQFAYNAYMYRWFMEASARWAESRVFTGEGLGETDAQRYYSYHLIDWFLHPDKSLELFNGRHEYGSVIFILYLSEKYGDGIIGEILEAMTPAVYRDFMNFREVFERRNSSIAREFKEFTLWNALTGGRYGLKIEESSGVRSDRYHYSRGAEYPSVAIFESDVHSDYPVKVTFTRQTSPEHMGARYVRFLPPPGGARTLSIRIDGDDVTDDELGLLYNFGLSGWGAMVLQIDWDEGTASVDEIIPFFRSQEGQINIAGFGDPIDEVILILSNLDPTYDLGTISYAAGMQPQIRPSSLLVAPDKDGNVILRWTLHRSEEVEGVKIIRKNAVFGLLELEEVYRSLATDNRGNDYFYFGAVLLADLPPDQKSYIDSTDLLGPMGEYERYYYYAVVPFTKEGLLGKPLIIGRPVAPVDTVPPTADLRIEKTGRSGLKISLEASEYLPMASPPYLSCKLPDGTGEEIELEAGRGNPYLFGSRIWEGILEFSPRMPSGDFTFSATMTDRGGNTGTVSSSYHWTAPVLPDVLAYPNPFGPNDDKVVFDTSAISAEEVRVRIFTVDGELVRTLTGKVKLEWDGKNAENRDVGDGVYIYHVEAEGIRSSGKIAVVR
ncbi:MAG TPA: hypothetical protein EYP53_02435 [Candidatus Latescibacteria bacterium]|nr:hypothetical protein [Candidatus Latescibacterota bacterium]